MMSNHFVDRRFVSGGRFSTVYRATDNTNGNSVALKITTPDDDRPPHSSRDEVRILQEIHSLPHSHRSHVIALLETFTMDFEDLVMVFPFYPYTLNTYLQNHARKTRFNPYAAMEDGASVSDFVPEYVSQLPPEKGRSVISKIAEGLHFLHSNGIIHRDIKPENIVFQNFDPEPVIIDLGISYYGETNFGKEKPLQKICDVSTGIYRAPELVFQITDYSFEIDIWSLGILMTLVFSTNLKPIFDNEDFGDFRLVSLMFKTFGTPTLETWPQAKKSSTFSRLEPLPCKPISVELALPRADDTVRQVFKLMMVYEPSKRLTAAQIHEKLEIFTN